MDSNDKVVIGATSEDAHAFRVVSTCEDSSPQVNIEDTCEDQDRQHRP